MNINHYNRAEIDRLIETAVPSDHEACDEMLERTQRSAVYFMRSSDRYQRQAHGWRAFSVACLGIIFCLLILEIGR